MKTACETICRTVERLFEGSRTWLLVILGMYLGFQLMLQDKLTAEGVVTIIGGISAYAWRTTKRGQTKTVTTEGKE